MMFLPQWMWDIELTVVTALAGVVLALIGNKIHDVLQWRSFKKHHPL